ncbi:hypothetical protein [Kribbella italica]|uniref:Uncharacterized protein n=1 Tax=Kribbella italica TaxID=1540520 RepID=A0A7W9J221_9ACTN|nr:hypothetical protein [Kribbella italica]MBB5833443.1 hypothetical protein [Kribbella italica]
MSRENPRSPEWAKFYENHPNVIASWGEANDRANNCPCVPCGVVVEEPAAVRADAGWVDDDEDLMAYASPDSASGAVFVAVEAADHLIAYLTPGAAERHARDILAAAALARSMNEED